MADNKLLWHYAKKPNSFQLFALFTHCSVIVFVSLSLHQLFWFYFTHQTTYFLQLFSQILFSYFTSRISTSTFFCKDVCLTFVREDNSSVHYVLGLHGKN